MGYISIFFATVMLGIWFAAVYLSHHYVVDVLSGIVTGIIGISLFNLLLNRSGWFKRFIARFQKVVL